MTHTISVANPTNHLYWQKQVFNEELDQVNDYLKGTQTIGLFQALIMVVRTDNLENFAKDLFFPTVCNHALRIKETAVKIIFTFSSLILDLMTLPIRVLTAIPRIIFNHKKEDNLFYKYLLANNVDRRILELNHVEVKIRTQQGPYVQSKDANGHVRFTPGWVDGEEKVIAHFIDLPVYDGSENRESYHYSSSSRPYVRNEGWEGYILA